MAGAGGGMFPVGGLDRWVGRWSPSGEGQWLAEKHLLPLSVFLRLKRDVKEKCLGTSPIQDMRALFTGLNTASVSAHIYLKSI